MNKPLLLLTAFSGLIAVALGAFGAHGLKPHLSVEALQWFETGNRYHFYHTFAALIVLLFLRHGKNRWFSVSGIAFLAGILLFSGSLYAMAVFGWKWLGPVTPLGGLLLIAGWILMLIGFLKKEN